MLGFGSGLNDTFDVEFLLYVNQASHAGITVFILAL